MRVTYDLAKVEDKDWNETWENNGFDPIDIYNHMVIYDARQTTPQLPEGAIPIAIQARQAFGTGTHQTTQMIIGLLLDMQLAGKRVLDCGCGTGILGIAASRLGAKEVVAYDIDEWSADNARHNAQLNHVENIEVLQGDANVLNHVSGVFDIVLANINRNILLQDMPAFRNVMMQGSVLILSGFFEEDCDQLNAKAESLGLKQTGKCSKGNWCCLQFVVK